MTDASATPRQGVSWRSKARRLALPLLFGMVTVVNFVVLSREETWAGGAVPPIVPGRLLYTILMFLAETPSGAATPATVSFQWAYLASVTLTLATVLQLVLRSLTRVVDWVTRQLLLNGHLVVCGLSRKGCHLARAHAEGGRRVVLIEKNPGHAGLDELRDMGVRVEIGDATQADTLRRAAVLSASRIVCVCDDGTNSEILHAVGLLARHENVKHPPCHLHIRDRHLYRALQYHESCSRRGAAGARVRFMNLASWGAARLLDWQPPAPCEAVPLFDADAAENHFVIIGAGAMGQAFAVECARRWSLTRHSKDTPPPLLTLVDRDGERHRAELEHHHPALKPYWRLRALTMEVPGVEFSRGDFLPGDGPPRRILVCLSDDSVSLLAGLETLRLLISRGWDRTMIVVRIAEDEGLNLSEVLQKNDTKWCRAIQPFRVMKEVLSVDVARYAPIEQIAMALHEAYLRGERAKHPNASPEDKPAMLDWELLAEEYRESARAQAASIVGALAGLPSPREISSDEGDGDPLTDGELDILSRREHDRWMQEKIDNGWRYGSPRDNEKRLHPNLVPWEQLDAPTQKIDRDMVEAWSSALKDAGFVIRRKAS